MSITIPRSPGRRYLRVARAFVATRGVEICALQASPLLGLYLGGRGFGDDSVSRFVLLALGSTALTAHVFAFNDWAGYTGDLTDRRRATLGAGLPPVERDDIARLALACLVLADIAFAALGPAAIVLGTGIAVLSFLYSFSPTLGKNTPIAASLNHLFGGALHFLLGYTVAHAVDARGAVLSVFFGIVFAAGHLNQEVRDHDADLANGIRTSAVAFGRRRAFLASFWLFTAAYLLIAGLAVLGFLPRILFLSGLVWLLQAGWTLQALRGGLGIETALWMQRRYRLLFALVGLAMLIR